jgi:Secretion system C-terminal sorting domain
MRSIFDPILLLLIPFFGYSQAMAPQVTNLAGTEATLGDFVITSSIGEPAILTFRSAGGFLTQGFLQPEILPCEKVEFRYFPNPAREKIVIEAYGCETNIESVQIIDLWGRLLYTGKTNAAHELYVGDLSQGVYVVRVFLTNGTTQTINLVKIAN